MAGTLTAPPPSDTAAGWRQSLYDGAPGIALLHVERARAGSGDPMLAHRWISAMTDGPVSADPFRCGLHYGAPAVAFAVHTARQPAYGPALAVLDRHIATLTRLRLDRSGQRIRAGALPALREYDLIRGLTGLGAYLLHRHCDDTLLRSVLDYLVRLTEPRRVDTMWLPGWWCPHGPADRPAPDWPGGHGNLGIAHGICGPLALLATAMLHGCTVAGHERAIGRICNWLDTYRRSRGGHTWWPDMISSEEHRSGRLHQASPGRPSWCYGTPGLARAQQLAGLALGDSARRRRAEQALADCLTDEAQLGQIRDASLCHGWAGLLHTTRQVARDADVPAAFRIDVPAGSLGRYVDRHGPPAVPGLLDGAAGVHLAQHAAATAGPSTGWDTCLLLGSTRQPSTRQQQERTR